MLSCTVASAHCSLSLSLGVWDLVTSVTMMMVLVQMLSPPGGKPQPGDCVEVYVDDGWWRTRVLSATAVAVTAPVGSATNIVTVPIQVRRQLSKLKLWCLLQYRLSQCHVMSFCVCSKPWPSLHVHWRCTVQVSVLLANMSKSFFHACQPHAYFLTFWGQLPFRLLQPHIFQGDQILLCAVCAVDRVVCAA